MAIFNSYVKLPEGNHNYAIYTGSILCELVGFDPLLS